MMVWLSAPNLCIFALRHSTRFPRSFLHGLLLDIHSFRDPLPLPDLYSWLWLDCSAGVGGLRLLGLGYCFPYEVASRC